MEEEAVYDLVREFFKYNKFETTLECFEAEVRSQHSFNRSFKTQYRSNKVPRIYSLTSGVASETSAEKQKEALLTAGRAIFAVAVEAVAHLEEAKLPIHDKVEGYKAQLAKLQEAVGLSVFAPTDADIGSPPFRKRLAEQLNKAVQGRQYPAVAEALLTVRAEALSFDSNAREKLIEGLVNDDILASSVLQLLMLRNFHAKYALFGVLSMLACTKVGKQYILLENPLEVSSKLMNELKEQEQGSVCQRFLLSILGKLTATEDVVCEFLVKSKFIDWVLKQVLHKQIIQREEANEFCQLFGAGLLLNLVNFASTQEYISQVPDSAKQWINQVLDLLLAEVDADTSYHLLLTLATIIKGSGLQEELGPLQLDRKLRKVVQYIQQICKDEVQQGIIVKLCEDLLENNPVVLTQPKEMPQIITFECFPDELKFTDSSFT